MEPFARETNPVFQATTRCLVHPHGRQIVHVQTRTRSKRGETVLGLRQLFSDLWVVELVDTSFTVLLTADFEDVWIPY